MWSAGRSGQTFKKRPFSGIFNSLGHFPKIFEQVKEPRKLELCGKIRLLHLFLYPMKFYLLCDQGQQCGVLNPTKNDQFQVFLAVGFLFPKLWACWGVAYYGTAQNHKSLTCSCVPICFSFVFWATLARKSVQNYENASFLGIFSRLGHFFQVFWQVKEWLMLELHEMIKVPHAVSFPMNLICFVIEFSREENSNVWKMIIF